MSQRPGRSILLDGLRTRFGMTTRRRAAMGGARQGRRKRPYRGDMGATEGAAARAHGRGGRCGASRAAAEGDPGARGEPRVRRRASPPQRCAKVLEWCDGKPVQTLRHQEEQPVVFEWNDAAVLAAARLLPDANGSGSAGRGVNLLERALVVRAHDVQLELADASLKVGNVCLLDVVLELLSRRRGAAEPNQG